MRGRVTAVLVLLLSLSSAAHSQCNWTPRYSGQFRSTALDVSIDNDFLWVATGYGVQLLRRTGTTLVSLDSAALPGSTRVVRANGSGLAYVGSGSSLFVVRRNGNSLEVVRSLDTGGTINDLEIYQGADLFVGTSKGVVHYSLVPADNPARSNAIFATSGQNVTGLATQGVTLYTADGDASVEMFNISIPALSQKVDQLESLPNTSSVHTADNFVYVSDRFGQNTDVFSGKTRFARLAFGSSSFAPATNRAHFLAGPDRVVRAVDLNDFTKVTELFETILPPTDGTDNTIHAMARTGNVVYVAAGDIGLVTLDTEGFARPYPLAGYVEDATTSSVVIGDRAWLSNAAGTISERRIDPQGVSLTQLRTWSAGAGALVHDHDNNTLLTASGATATLWSLAPTTPAVARTVTFASSVSHAVLRGDTIVALLTDGTMQIAPATTAQTVTLPKMSSLARYGSAVGTTEIQKEGKTVLHYWANGDVTSAARTVSVDGAVIGNLALDQTRAAIFLFNGVNLIDLASGAVQVIPGSDTTVPIQLAFSANDLLVLSARSLTVYDEGQHLLHTQSLPSTAIAMGVAAPYAVIASADGVIASLYLRSVPAPALTNESNFYSRMAADGTHVYLLSRDGVDIYTTAASDAPHYAHSIRAKNIADIAADRDRLFTLSGTGSVTAWSHAGAQLAQSTFNEGFDTQPLSLHTVGGAVWVSISKGCLSGGCENKTLVLDPQTLLVTDTFPGEVVDVTAVGTRAYVLSNVPREIRVVNITDPQHPATIISVAAPTSSRSIAASGGIVYVLGDKVYAYAEASLTATTTFLAAANPTNAHSIRIAGSCVIVNGRTANPELFTLPAFTPVNGFNVPSTVREVIVTPTRVLLLTDHSIEVWKSGTNETNKRRGVR
jgi:hypothetical protein